MLLSTAMTKTITIFALSMVIWPFNQTLTHFNTATIPIQNQYSFQKQHKSSEPKANEEVPALKTIVIDAGHGGHDPGCSGKDAKEKHIALAIAKYLASSMRAKYPQMKVILTRDSDVFIPLYKRAKIANQNQADLFISIHCNAAASNPTRAHGTETFVMGLHTAKQNLDVAKRENAAILLEENYQQNYDYDPNSPEGHIMLSMFQNAYLDQSIQFAEQVEKQFMHFAGRKSRGVKQAGFVVLKATTMPSVLIETGFLTNPDEELYLHNSTGQKAIAQAILNAFSNYKNTVESGKQNHEYTRVDPPKPAPAKPKKKIYYRDQYEQQQQATTIKPKTNQSDYVKIVDKQHTYQRIPKVYQRKPTKNHTKPLDFDPKKIQFRVQLAASSRPLNTNTKAWMDLKNQYRVEVITEDRQYKYQVIQLKNYDQADRTKDKLRILGFPQAFVVAYQGTKKIPLNQVKRALAIP